MNVRRQFRTFERFGRWWWTRFTPGGKAISLLAIYSLPAVVTFNDSMPFVGITAMMVLLLTTLLARVFRPRLETEVRSPQFATVNRAFPITAQVRNLSGQPALDLSARVATRDPTWRVEPFGEPGSLAAAETDTYTLQVTATRRGVLQLPPVDVLTTFPMNLIRTPVTRTSTGLVGILPPALPLVAGTRSSVSELLGVEQRMLATAGNGFDYIGSREYVEGPVRRWDYASWARLGLPVVREFAQDADRQVSILIDTRDRADGKRLKRGSFEPFLTCTYSLIEYLLTDEIEIVLCAVGDEVSHELTRAGNYGHSRLRTMLAAAEQSNKTDITAHVPEFANHTGGPALVFLRGWDSDAEDLIERLARANPCVRPILFRTDTDAPAPMVSGLTALTLTADGGVDLR